MNVCSCVHDNTESFTQDTLKCKQDVRLNKNEPSKCCVELPYHNDKSSTIELLTFIIHGDNSATLINTQSDKMLIVYKPSEWRSQQSFLIKFFDNVQIMKICSENSKDWFGSQKNFLLALQQKYLNVADKG
jgi:hypothetical protein